MAPLVVVYTAIYGDYDTLRDQPRNTQVAYRCFGDRRQSTRLWQFVPQKRRQITAVLDARQCKILAHNFITDCQYSIWLDSNNRLWDDPIKICDKWLAQANMAVFRHPHRDCIYDEIEACVRYKKDDPQLMREHVARYKAEGYPEHNGLMATGFIARRHCKEVSEFNNFWWGEVISGSHRDQLSFPYAVWRTGMKIQLLPGNARKIVDVHFPHTPYRGK
jgi:hypothetical protein